VPRVCEFYGIVIWLYYDEHPPPHFHATYGEHAASLSIDSGEVLAGELPRRALRLVAEWAELHRDELAAMWARAAARQPLGRIDPLP